MATELNNLSLHDKTKLPSAAEMSFGILVSEWNSEITEALKQGAYDTLTQAGAKEENIRVMYVPGSFELVYGAKKLQELMRPDAIIALGSVVKGDTPHFDYVCSGVTQGFASLNAAGSIPFIFGLLTTDNMQQALDRCGGVHGNKGVEAAITAIKMIDFTWSLK
ncbi:6,7-dimethyl-8-ribityllumazine synthase [Bacteroidales bacterium]|nr:6,7-dimethyl-8-ribityllumazine synthase [Bacteroidales bacterium]